MRRTYYLRDLKTGEIVNAVETDSGLRAQEIAEKMDPPCYPDDRPPLEVLQRYRFWYERP